MSHKLNIVYKGFFKPSLISEKLIILSFSFFYSYLDTILAIIRDLNSLLVAKLITLFIKFTIYELYAFLDLIIFTLFFATECIKIDSLIKCLEKYWF